MSHRGRRTSPRAALAAVAALTAGLAAPVGATAQPLRHVPCSALAASPTFAADHVLFCAGATRDASGVDLYRSGDAGHTWTGPFPVERGQPHNDFADGIYVSPRYSADHTVYVSTYDSSGYVSTDSGATFAALGGTDLVSPANATPFIDGTAGAALRPDLIVASALRPAGCCNMIYDPALPPRPTPADPQVVSSHFIVPPDYPSTHQAVMLSQQLAAGTAPLDAVYGHARAYQCNGNFVCTTSVFDFPPAPGDDDTSIDWAGPTYYPSSPDNYVLVASGRKADSFAHPHLQVYRTTDYGHTWAPWPSVTKLVAPLGLGEEVFINASPDAPHRLFLHLTGPPPNPPGIPDQQLYRSDNNGATWHRIGYAWGPEQVTRVHSTLPWNTVPVAYGATVVEPGGRLYLVAEHDTGKHVDYSGLYCSRDYGAHWSTSC